MRKGEIIRGGHPDDGKRSTLPAPSKASRRVGWNYFAGSMTSKPV